MKMTVALKMSTFYLFTACLHVIIEHEWKEFLNFWILSKNVCGSTNYTALFICYTIVYVIELQYSTKF